MHRTELLHTESCCKTKYGERIDCQSRICASHGTSNDGRVTVLSQIDSNRYW